jgi:hypothetical protein
MKNHLYLFWKKLRREFIWQAVPWRSLMYRNAKAYIEKGYTNLPIGILQPVMIWDVKAVRQLIWEAAAGAA